MKSFWLVRTYDFVLYDEKPVRLADGNWPCGTYHFCLKDFMKFVPEAKSLPKDVPIRIKGFKIKK